MLILSDTISNLIIENWKMFQIPTRKRTKDDYLFFFKVTI